MTEISQRGGFGSRNTQVVFNDAVVDIVRSPSIFMDLVAILAIQPSQSDLSDDFVEYNIESKIEHNFVIKHREKIESYYAYVSMIDNAYQTLCEMSPSARETALSNINSCYKNCVGDLLLENKISLINKNREERERFRLELIQQHADLIIDCVIHHVQRTCSKSLTATQCSIEEIQNHSELIVFHAFVECKVLEKP